MTFMRLPWGSFLNRGADSDTNIQNLNINSIGVVVLNDEQEGSHHDL